MRKKLWGKIVLCHMMIMLGEMVALEAKGTNPQFVDKVYLSIRAQKSRTSPATKRWIRERLLVREVS